MKMTIAERTSNIWKMMAVRKRTLKNVVARRTIKNVAAWKMITVDHDDGRSLENGGCNEDYNLKMVATWKMMTMRIMTLQSVRRRIMKMKYEGENRSEQKSTQILEAH